MSKSYVRYDAVRKADTINDQATAGQIAAGYSSAVTQEDLQSFILSQIKRVIFGGNTGTWSTDFISASIPSLTQLSALAASGVLSNQLYTEIALDDIPTQPSATYSATLISGLVTAETWLRSSDSSRLKDIIYSYTGSIVSQEVHSVYDTDGTTILAKKTVAYTYPGGGAPPTYTVVRNI